MYFDAVTISALRDEFEEKIGGGRVQEIIEIDDLTMGIEIYSSNARNYLVLSAHPQKARVLLAGDKLRRGKARPSPLGLLMKKYLVGARLLSIIQPRHERLIQFDFSGEEGVISLIAEIMDNRSNVILIKEGVVLEASKHIRHDVNRYREILPRNPYLPPPPIQKKSPDEINATWIEGIIRGNNDVELWRILVQALAGVSPLLAREITHRAHLDDAEGLAASAVRIEQTVKEMFRDISDHKWEPGSCISGDEKQVVAYAAYRITSIEGWLPSRSMSSAAEVYFANPGAPDTYAAGKEAVRTQIAAALADASRKQAALQRELQDDDEIDDLRIRGELILASLRRIPERAEQFAAQYDFEQPPIIITLDPALNPLENAQEYFDKYNRAKKARANLPLLVEDTMHVIAYLEQMALDLAIAENWPEIDEVKEALVSGGFWKGRRDLRPKGSKPGVRRFVTSDGHIVLVGRNAHQNHDLVTEKSKVDDLWLHAQGMAGCHVIIKSDGRSIPEAVVQFAASLAAYYSSSRGEISVPVVITERRYVRPIKGAGPGLVTYRNEKTLKVSPAKK